MKCQGLIGLIAGHNYQPVFNTEPQGRLESLSGGDSESLATILDWDTKKTYVHTECARCGHKLEQTI